jgi:hypothetical protein
MSKMQKYKDAAPSIHGLVQLSQDGTPEESEGTIDKDTAAAVAVTATRQLRPAVAGLGLGGLQGWSIGTAKSTFYVAFPQGKGVAAAGGESKKSEIHLRNLVRCAREN